MKKNHLTLSMLAVLLHATHVQAETFYITDKVLVGVYENANTESVLVKALPTGTPLEVLERNGEFSKIRSPDGTSGWVESSYLIDNKPAQLVVLELTDQQKQANEQLSLAQAELKATQKQLVNLRAKKKSGSSKQDKALAKELIKTKKKSDQLKKELVASQKQLENKSLKHDSIEKHNKALQKEIIALRKNKPGADVAISTPAVAIDDSALKALQAKNTQLTSTLNQVREALNLPANSAENAHEGGIFLKTMWLLIGALVLSISGFIGGIKWLDWRNLKRHGGFRI